MKSISSIELKAKIIKNYLIKLASMALPTDSFFRNVILLLHGDGDNGQQNNTILDSSVNNFTVTRNGNVAQGTFSAFGDIWSNYFDGTGDYLSRAFTSTTDGMYPQGTTYTIEAWFYASATTDVRIIYDCSASNVTSFGGVWLGINAGAAQFNCRPTTGGTLTSISGGSIVANSWNHIAISVNAGNGKLFLNGTQVGSTTTISACSFTPVGASIGRFSNGYNIGVTDYAGYISNARLVQSTALYTNNFTPSTTPLTAIANTSLLTCQNNRFIDASTNNFTITRNGNVSIERFAPFAPTVPYSLTAIGGAAYFDGFGDNLRITSSNLNIGTDQFTVEAWVYPTTSSGRRGIYGFGPSAGDTLYLGSSAQLILNFDGAGTSMSGGSVPQDVWTHIAASRDASNMMRIFVNGVLVASATNSYNINSNSPLVGGRAGDGLEGYTGYISNLRVIKGTALYTGNFTIPTAPLTAIANTQLLLNFTNGGIVDNSMICNAETIGHPNISTSIKKYGSGSIYFDGVGDYLKIRGSKDFNFTSGNFTIELWINCSSFTGATRTILSKDGVLNTSNSQYSIFIDSTGKINATVGSGDGLTYAQSIVSGNAISTGVWYHIAFVKNDNTLILFLNGVEEASATQTGTMTNGDKNLIIGWEQDQYTSYYFDGYIDDLRITKGIARYTSNFTPPTAQFPDL